jgi:putative peptide maturation dehydrogenase
MLIRRCAILLIEPRERFEFDFDSLLKGGAGLRTQQQWLALAPHLDEAVNLSAEEIVSLGSVSSQDWIGRERVAGRFGDEVIRALLAKGLLIGDSDEFTAVRDRDERLRDGYWHPLTAVAHAFGRWDGVTSGENVRSVGIVSVTDLVNELGEPPPHFHERSEASQRIALGAPDETTPLDDLLRRRTVCRNYDAARPLPRALFDKIVHRVFAAQATHHVTQTAAIVKKTSPSAGGLHPTEAYFLIQHVDGIAPGLYHYHAGDHALEPLQSLSPEEAHALAMRFLAHQDWFANAHAIAILAPRFLRSFWKYRAHAKVYRAVTLDVGHLSQTLQISATEFGLGAFVTSAINEADIERALQLEPMREGPLAICGFGWRAETCARMEFDPLHAVWPKA